jgi:hypothetical protein
VQRLLAASWRQIANHDEIARAAATTLSADAMRDAHASAREAIHELIERGRHEGAFRTDVPSGWLVTASLALVHATAEEVRMRQLSAKDAPRVLSLAIGDLIGARKQAPARRRRGQAGSRRT